MAVTQGADGIINPPIDELLEIVDSKYRLVIIAAKRARQINAYYSQLGEGLLEYVGPLVETRVQEKPLSIALREAREGLLKVERPKAKAARLMARVILGVGAGIAAYKACELLRLLKEAGHAVRVIPTPDALRFVGEPTWAALSGEPVTTDVWTGVADVPHVQLGQVADLVIVAPATADLLARAAAGLSGDLLTATLLTARCPVVFAPAMHTEMWEHPATQHNVATLRARGAVVVEPAVGRLTGKDSGKGRLPEPAELFALAERVLAPRTGENAAPVLNDDLSLAGKRVLVSAGGTREELDPVRFLGNWSTGRQGYAFARSAAARGADVTLVAANVELPDPAGAKVVRVVSARDMHAAMLAEAPLRGRHRDDGRGRRLPPGDARRPEDQEGRRPFRRPSS